jgi:hypothetical protein
MYEFLLAEFTLKLGGSVFVVNNTDMSEHSGFVHEFLVTDFALEGSVVIVVADLVHCNSIDFHFEQFIFVGTWLDSFKIRIPGAQDLLRLWFCQVTLPALLWRHSNSIHQLITPTPNCRAREGLNLFWRYSCN